MVENQLGKNIKYLRNAHGETLEELGCILCCAKSTVKGYENGSRNPDLETLKRISVHYHQSVDELMYSNLTCIDVLNIDVNSAQTFANIMNSMFPLYSSESAMENDNFKKGYRLLRKMIDSLSNNKILPGNTIVTIFEYFIKALEESYEPIIAADALWCVFFWWSQIQQDADQMRSLQNKMLSKKLTFKDFLKLRDTTSIEIKEKCKEFILDFEPIVINLLKILKRKQDWSELADYYLAMTYIVGIKDTDLTPEMNSSVGNQMMLSFMELGNKLAIQFYDYYLSS